MKCRSSELEEEIKSLLKTGGDKLRSQNSKIDQTKDNLINEQIIKSQVKKSKAKKDIIRFEKSLAKGDKEIDLLTEQIQQKAEVIRSIRAKDDKAKPVFI